MADSSYFMLNFPEYEFWYNAIESDDYKMIEIHETVMDGDKASMKSVKSLYHMLHCFFPACEDECSSARMLISIVSRPFK